MKNETINGPYDSKKPYVASALLYGKDMFLQEMLAIVLVDMGIRSQRGPSGSFSPVREKFRPTIIIIDCSLPGDEHNSDGLNLNSENPIPIIFLSPYTQSELDYQPQSHQIFIDKPFDVKHFIDSVNYLLKKSSNVVY